MALDRPPEIVVLDVMLPSVDGLEVCRRLRLGDAAIPILMLIAKERVPDRVAGRHRRDGRSRPGHIRAFVT
ncbi:MAG: response regulator [Nitrososphaerales archaeon]